MTPTFSIITPTCDRPTLRAALDSALSQMGTGDECLVIGDGPCPMAEALCYSLLCADYFQSMSTRNWGNHQRQNGMRHADGSHLLFLDDDDVFVDGALNFIREVIEAHPTRPYLFQFVDKNGALLWADQSVRMGNVSTQMICFPNDPSRLGKWGERREGDYDFIRSTLDLYPDGDAAVVWRPNVVQIAG